MNEHATSEEKLLKEVLDRANTNVTIEDTADLELLTMFVEGQLTRERATDVLELLDRDSEARETVSLLLKARGEQGNVEPRKKKKAWKVRNVAIFAAVAASLLIVVGLLYLPGQLQRSAENRAFQTAQRQLKEERYEEARQTLEESTSRGIESERLRQLHLQALLESPSPVALASLGRLSEFGYSLDGFAARAPISGQDLRRYESALNFIDKHSAGDEQTELNLGYTLLKLDRTVEAEKVFDSFLNSNPNSPSAWLGLGLARYLQHDLENAEVSFRQCLKSDSKNTAARINLAMTLTELGKLEQAFEQWKSVPQDALTPAEQQQLKTEMKNLRQFMQQEGSDR